MHGSRVTYNDCPKGFFFGVHLVIVEGLLGRAREPARVEHLGLLSMACFERYACTLWELWYSSCENPRSVCEILVVVRSGLLRCESSKKNKKI